MGEVSSFVLPPSSLVIDGITFPAFVTPPDSSNPFFLGGAGVRGLDIGGQFIKFTAIGVYLEESALQILAQKWSSNTADEITGSLEFYRDIINGPFKKFYRIVFLRHLTGEQYTDKVIENSVNHWKVAGISVEEQAEAVDKFKDVFKPETFPPGTSIFFTQCPSGSISIAFSKDDSVPETNNAVIEKTALSYTVLETIIGEIPVSPAAKRSLAVRFSEHFKSLSPTISQAKEQMEIPSPQPLEAALKLN
ncbi:hypothetical protein LUZ63_008606 [Rhynchospora breviuscula]|uniref:Chalcone-flavonone isomerase family protein n=1 Tax=Rhynchospora breviuscula TaxID=2022672 RepID=A0A9Q0HVI8_9POAL|nr:hypothetical protein LUZ63_008606 [Rhynchospora breviuscula]